MSTAIMSLQVDDVNLTRIGQFGELETTCAATGSLWGS